MRAIALLAALPLYAITLALVIPPALPAAFGLAVLAFTFSMLAALALIVANLWVLVKQTVG